MNTASLSAIPSRKGRHTPQSVSRKKGKRRHVSKNTVTPSRLENGTNVQSAIRRRESRGKAG